MTMPFTPETPSSTSDRLRDEERPHAVALITRVSGATAARPGARAVIGEDGALESGFLGGGCVTGAVRRAAAEALRSGQPVMLALRPAKALGAIGVEAGETRDGWLYARNGCPSEGHVDVFVEPVIPLPMVVVLGSGPVAEALARIAAAMRARIHHAAPGQAGCDGFDWSEAVAPAGHARDAIVVATQGSGDRTALRAALSSPASYLGFVASRRKAETLRSKLQADGVPTAMLERIRAPAGLDLGAETPEEIALSIFAEIQAHRRKDGSDAQ